MTPEEASEIYRRYAPLIHSRARRLVGDEADDIVHDVMLRFLGRPPVHAEALPWLLTSTTNACLDRLRHQARRNDAWRAEARAAFGDGEISIEGLVEAKEACRRLLGRIDAKTAQVAAMVFVDGMSQEEVAALLGVTRTAIAKRLQRFLRDAREELGVSEKARQTSSR